MRIYRLAAMFKTFGFEDKLCQSFKSHYIKKISGQPSSPEEIMDRFNDKKFLYLGESNISEGIKPIVDHYGYPQVDIPKKIYFGLLHPGNPSFPSNASAFFYMGSDGVCYILKVTSDPFNVVFDVAFDNTIRHETQHFLRSLYEGFGSHLSAEKDGGIDGYYGDAWEVQAYSGNIANSAMENIKSVFGPKMVNKSPERIEEIKNNLRKNKGLFTSSFLVKSIQRFFDDIELGEDGKLSPEIKRKYYKSAYRDFSRLFDEYFS